MSPWKNTKPKRKFKWHGLAAVLKVFVDKEELKFGLMDAVSNFNMGAQTVLQLYEALQIPAGKYTEDGCQFLEAERSYKAVYKDKEHKK